MFQGYRKHGNNPNKEKMSQRLNVKRDKVMQYKKIKMDAVVEKDTAIISVFFFKIFSTFCLLMHFGLLSKSFL